MMWFYNIWLLLLPCIALVLLLLLLNEQVLLLDMQICNSPPTPNFNLALSFYCAYVCFKYSLFMVWFSCNLLLFLL